MPPNWEHRCPGPGSPEQSLGQRWGAGGREAGRGGETRRRVPDRWCRVPSGTLVSALGAGPRWGHWASVHGSRPSRWGPLPRARIAGALSLPPLAVHSRPQMLSGWRFQDWGGLGRRRGAGGGRADVHHGRLAPAGFQHLGERGCHAFWGLSSSPKPDARAGRGLVQLRFVNHFEDGGSCRWLAKAESAADTEGDGLSGSDSCGAKIYCLILGMSNQFPTNLPGLSSWVCQSE